MKVTTENNVKNFILNRINKVYIGFNDNIEVSLNDVIGYDVDLCDGYNSNIELTSVTENVEIINYFKSHKRTRIIYVRIEAQGFSTDKETCKEFCKVFYDIPCDMKINRLRIDGCINDCSKMVIELEGLVE